MKYWGLEGGLGPTWGKRLRLVWFHIEEVLLSSSSHLAGQEEKGWKSSPATFLECRPSSRAAPWHVRNSTGHKSHQNASHSFNHITESAVGGTGRQQLGQDWEISNIRRFARVSSFPMGVAWCRLVPMSVLIRDWAPIQGCTRASKYIQYILKRWAVCHHNCYLMLQEWWWSPSWLYHWYQRQLWRTHNVCNGPPPSSPTLHDTVTRYRLHVTCYSYTLHITRCTLQWKILHIQNTYCRTCRKQLLLPYAVCNVMCIICSYLCALFPVKLCTVQFCQALCAAV